MIDHYEIERKYLIKKPDESLLSTIHGAVRYEIEQYYLPVSYSEDGARIRKRKTGDTTECFFTVKKKINDLKRIEDEHIISLEEYDSLAEKWADISPCIKKTRWCVPFGCHTAEIDIMPFWKNNAILEVEMTDEYDSFVLPDFIKVIKEVTGERRYLNRDMAFALYRHEDIPE